MPLAGDGAERGVAGFPLCGLCAFSHPWGRQQPPEKRQAISRLRQDSTAGGQLGGGWQQVKLKILKL